MVIAGKTMRNLNEKMPLVVLSFKKREEKLHKRLSVSTFIGKYRKNIRLINISFI